MTPLILWSLLHAARETGSSHPHPVFPFNHLQTRALDSTDESKSMEMMARHKIAVVAFIVLELQLTNYTFNDKMKILTILPLNRI